MDYTFTPIGIIHSCFKEKFGIPRQPGLVPLATAELELLPPYNREEALRGLDGFSHIWITFVFHGTMAGGWKPTVRPPRLGGNKRIGVFATRSTFRPNPIGLSAVRLTGIAKRKNGLFLELAGVDLLDQTPVLDIKPYLPYSDIIEEATGGFAPSPPEEDITVHFSGEAEAALAEREMRGGTHLRPFIVQMLGSDPAPAYRSASQNAGRSFGARVFDLDIRWEINGKALLVTAVETPGDAAGHGAGENGLDARGENGGSSGT